MPTSANKPIVPRSTPDSRIHTSSVEPDKASGRRTGAATAAFEYALAYAKTRKQFGRAIGQFQAISHKLADMKVMLDISRMLVYRYAWLMSQGKATRHDAAVVKLHTRLDSEAIYLARGRTEMPAAVARLAQLIPPARVDLVVEVMVGAGRRDLSVTHDWPPIHLVHQLAYRVKRVHLGEVRMTGRTARWWK